MTPGFYVLWLWFLKTYFPRLKVSWFSPLISFILLKNFLLEYLTIFLKTFFLFADDTGEIIVLNLKESWYNGKNGFKKKIKLHIENEIYLFKVNLIHQSFFLQWNIHIRFQFPTIFLFHFRISLSTLKFNFNFNFYINQILKKINVKTLKHKTYFKFIKKEGHLVIVENSFLNKEDVAFQKENKNLNYKCVKVSTNFNNFENVVFLKSRILWSWH